MGFTSASNRTCSNRLGLQCFIAEAVLSLRHARLSKKMRLSHTFCGFPPTRFVCWQLIREFQTSGISVERTDVIRTSYEGTRSSRLRSQGVSPHWNRVRVTETCFSFASHRKARWDKLLTTEDIHHSAVNDLALTFVMWCIPSKVESDLLSTGVLSSSLDCFPPHYHRWFVLRWPYAFDRTSQSRNLTTIIGWLCIIGIGRSFLLVRHRVD